RIGDGSDTRFWFDLWIGDSPLHIRFHRLFALELDKEISMADKMHFPLDHSFRRIACDGLERHQMTQLQSMLDLVSLSQSRDRWFCDLTGDGEFRVKDVRNSIDDIFLPSSVEPTRWVKHIPIKVNIFAWRARRDCLPTRVNLIRRGISLNLTFVRSVDHVRRMRNTSFSNVIWRNLSGVVFVDGGIWFRSYGCLFWIGKIGSTRFVLRLRLSLY
nr:RNA-directed DNA polymerase, eukaryota [Tanacetum cinerariifolium]